MILACHQHPGERYRTNGPLVLVLIWSGKQQRFVLENLINKKQQASVKTIYFCKMIFMTKFCGCRFISSEHIFRHTKPNKAQVWFGRFDKQVLVLCEKGSSRGVGVCVCVGGVLRRFLAKYILSEWSLSWKNHTPFERQIVKNTFSGTTSFKMCVTNMVLFTFCRLIYIDWVIWVTQPAPKKYPFYSDFRTHMLTHSSTE